MYTVFSISRAQKGGALFVDDSTCILNYHLQILAISQVGPSVHIMFVNNTGLSAGNNIYGGWLDWTIKKGQMTYNSNRVVNSLEFLDNDPGIASDPI